MAEQLTGEPLSDISPVEELVTQWAEYTLERLQAQLKRRNIEASGELKRQLRKRVFQQGHLLIARFQFPIQGKFVDMGVGNGVRAATREAYRSAASKGLRKKKPWFNRPFYGRYYWLAEAVAVNIAESIVEIKPGRPKMKIYDVD